MSRSPLRRTRLAAASAIALAGTIATGAFTAPAQAGCVDVTLYYYENKQGREYIFNDWCAVDVPGWRQWAEPYGGEETDSDYVPPGTPTGAGFSVWIPVPPI